MTLARAPVFLIRLTKAPPTVQHTLLLESSVASHYLTMSIDLLELGDLSGTGLSTYLARAIPGTARAAGLGIRREGLKNTAVAEGSCQPFSAERPGQSPQVLISEQEELSFLGDSLSGNQILDTNSFWGGHHQIDLSYFLRLSGGVSPSLAVHGQSKYVSHKVIGNEVFQIDETDLHIILECQGV